MFLSDNDIMGAIALGNIVIEPFDPEVDLQPASVDLHLDNEFKTFSSVPNVIDPKVPQIMVSRILDKGLTFVLRPGDFVLASTIEKITLGLHIVGRLEGKSSVGRLGLTTHVTAGFFDPGFSGYGTLELANLSGHPILLYPGMKICQMSFAYLNTPPSEGYGKKGSKYQNQPRGPQESQYHRNFKE